MREVTSEVSAVGHCNNEAYSTYINCNIEASAMRKGCLCLIVILMP